MSFLMKVSRAVYRGDGLAGAFIRTLCRLNAATDSAEISCDHGSVLAQLHVHVAEWLAVAVAIDYHFII